MLISFACPQPRYKFVRDAPKIAAMEDIFSGVSEWICMNEWVDVCEGKRVCGCVWSEVVDVVATSVHCVHIRWLLGGLFAVASMCPNIFVVSRDIASIHWLIDFLSQIRIKSSRLLSIWKTESTCGGSHGGWGGGGVLFRLVRDVSMAVGSSDHPPHLHHRHHTTQELWSCARSIQSQGNIL